MKAGDKLDEPSGVREDNDALVKFEVFPGISLDVLLAERFLETLDAGFQLRQAG